MTLMRTADRSVAAVLLGLVVFVCGSCAQSPGTQANELPVSQSPEITEPAVTALSGAQLYQSNCADCHDQPFYKAPSRMMISGLGPKNILKAMTDGAMRSQAAAIGKAGREAIAEYVSGRRLSDISDSALPPFCDAAHAFDVSRPPVSRGWGVDLRNSRFQPEATGGLSATNVSDLEVKWSFAYPNAFQARSQLIYGGGAVSKGVSHSF